MDALTAQTTASQLLARLERMPSNRIQILARIVMGSATFFDAYEAIALAYAMPSILREWSMAPATIGLVIGAAYFGQVFGALICGWLAEKYGRLRTASWTVGVFAVMSIVCTFSYSAVSLGAFRFLQGVGIGGEVPVAGTYISELCGAKGRGRTFLLYAMIFPVGLVAAGATGWLLVPIYGWRVMFYIGALPAVIAMLARLLLPESPRWLIANGRMAEAEAIIAGMEQAVLASGRTLPPPSDDIVAPISTHSRFPWREIFQGIYGKRTALLWGLWICTYLIINGLTTWLPTIYTSIFHLPVKTAIGFGLITNACSLVGTFTTALLIDKVGRRNWYIMSFCISTIPLAALWWLGATSAMQVMVLATSGYFFIGTVGTSLYLYTAELYPTRIRAAGSSAASAWARLASAFSPALVGIIIATNGISGVFGALALVSAVGAIVCIAFAVESRRRILEELSP